MGNPKKEFGIFREKGVNKMSAIDYINDRKKEIQRKIKQYTDFISNNKYNLEIAEKCINNYESELKELNDLIGVASATS